MAKPMRTDNQKEIMGVILKAADQGEYLSVTELYRRLQAKGYKSAYGSLRCSLRFLLARGVVTRETAGQFCLYKPTVRAYAFFRTGQ